MLTPDQVAGIYSRLRRRLAPEREIRTSSVKHHRLASHVGPLVRWFHDKPGRVPRRGRPRIPGPTGLAFYIEPIDGHTWNALRASWNEKCRETPEATDWVYNRSSHFIRDAEKAVQRLLRPDWEWRPAPPAV